MTSPDTLVDHLNPFLQRRRVEQLRNMQRRQQDTITSPLASPPRHFVLECPACPDPALPAQENPSSVPPNSIPALQQGEQFREMQSGERSHKIKSFLFQTKTAVNPAVLSYDIACTYGRQLQTARSIPDVDRSDLMFLDLPDLMDVSDSDSEERSSGVVKIRTK
ncbi:hypothetical protein B0H17DRAFT_1220100 [Mycena rosella]|uniref:Uncharacterized protein n=1 Tax=Mycena rosella TaxID=1033263 RepID=A0AAD7BCV8_MYCRO|nr:hypothetical protein B0H17DRAFT_1220100 [Mycena rosella]